MSAPVSRQSLPPEARICLEQGLCLAGGFATRIAANLAGLCERATPKVDNIASARPDIDFYLVVDDADAALLKLRATLIALSVCGCRPSAREAMYHAARSDGLRTPCAQRHCEANQNGMCVVRSPYAITVAMDDCEYDLQIARRTGLTQRLCVVVSWCERSM